MKISKLLFALVVGAALVSCNKYGENHHEVPQSAKNAFVVGYPGATEAKWEKDGDMFEVDFKYHYADYEVKYDKGGYIVQVEYSLENKFLPAGIMEKVEAKYPGKKISADYVEYRRFPFYEIEISEDTHHAKEGEHAEEGHEIKMYFTTTGEEFDGEKKVACIEECHGTLCKPKKDYHGKKERNGEKKTEYKVKEGENHAHAGNVEGHGEDHEDDHSDDHHDGDNH